MALHGRCLVSGSNRVIYILPLLLSYKYNDIVVSWPCCDKQHFSGLNFLLVDHWGGCGSPQPPPKYAHVLQNIDIIGIDN